MRLLPGAVIPLSTVWPEGEPAPPSRTDSLPLNAEAPRRFALCAEEPEGDGWQVVGWGLEFDDEAVVYLRDPAGERSTHGIFASADRACALFSRIAPLRTVWT